MAPTVSSSSALQVPQAPNLRSSQTNPTRTNSPVLGSPNSQENSNFEGSDTDKPASEGEDGERGPELLKSPRQAKRPCRKSSGGHADSVAALKKRRVENGGKAPAKKAKRKLALLQKVRVLYLLYLLILSS